MSKKEIPQIRAGKRLIKLARPEATGALDSDRYFGWSGQMRSKTVRSAGKSVNAVIQQSIIPMSPMMPNCLKPRKLVKTSDPYETPAARAAVHVAFEV